MSNAAPSSNDRLQLLVITLSDRAAAGAYADRSGPRACQLLEDHFGERGRSVAIERRLLPDDPKQLREQLTDAIDRGTDVVFTVGGTGVGPRDIAPDVVAPLCDRLIPGIMEQIRIKFGAVNPKARLSRAIAGAARTTQIYTLPGSVRAVDEYLPEILATLEHVHDLLHGIDSHPHPAA